MKGNRPCLLTRNGIPAKASWNALGYSLHAGDLHGRIGRCAPFDILAPVPRLGMMVRWIRFATLTLHGRGGEVVRSYSDTLISGHTIIISAILSVSNIVYREREAAGRLWAERPRPIIIIISAVV